MPYVDASTLLAAVRNAIQEIVERGIERYEIDTGANRRGVQYLRLSELRSLEQQLVREVDRQRTGGVRVAVLRRPSP